MRHQCRQCQTASYRRELCIDCYAIEKRLHIQQDIVDAIGALSIILFVALMFWAFGN